MSNPNPVTAVDSEWEIPDPKPQPTKQVKKTISKAKQQVEKGERRDPLIQVQKPKAAVSSASALKKQEREFKKQEVLRIQKQEFFEDAKEAAKQILKIGIKELTFHQMAALQKLYASGTAKEKKYLTDFVLPTMNAQAAHAVHFALKKVDESFDEAEELKFFDSCENL